MISKIFTITCIIFFFSCSTEAFSSVNNEENGDIYYKIVTKDEREIQGRLVRETDDDITLDTEELGEITISRERIAVVREYTEEDYRAPEEDPNPLYTRYLFATNAMGLERGKGYYQNTWIFFNNVNYGFTDNFSMGAGTVPVFLFGVSAFPVWLLPKFTYSVSENFHVGAGAMFGGILGSGFDGGFLGLGYLVSTIGDKDKNLSVGIGRGLSFESSNASFSLNFSGMVRLTSSSYFITENWVFVTDDDNFGIVSIAGRWAPGNVAVDYGLFRPWPLFDVGFIAFPWLGVSIPFGGK